MTNVMKGQNEIRWVAMMQGYVHKEWSEIQEKYYMDMGLNSRIYCKKRWRREFINILTQYSRECWMWRNEAIHGKTVVEGRDLRLNKLCEQVKKIYAKRREMSEKQRKNLFGVPLEKRMKFGVQALILWIGKAEEVLKLNREQAAKYMIHQWLGS